MSIAIQYVRYRGYLVGDDGTVWSVHTGKELTQRISHGYCEVTLYINKKVHKRVHCLVLEAFVGPCPPGMECRHLDGNRQENHLWNLCWGTKEENMEDREKHGRNVRGSQQSQAKLTETDIPVIRAAMASGQSKASLSKQYGVSSTMLKLIERGEKWAHV